MLYVKKKFTKPSAWQSEPSVPLWAGLAGGMHVNFDEAGLGFLNARSSDSPVRFIESYFSGIMIPAFLYGSSFFLPLLQNSLGHPPSKT